MNYKEQYDRVMRHYNRINDTDKLQKEYEDDLRSFFQNCWHLKDWLKNDPNITVADSIIENYANNSYYLKICADLCNRTKHLKLTSKRVDADFKGNSVRIFAPTIGSNEVGWVEYEYYIGIDNNTTLNALDVARNAIGEWNTFFRTHNINI